MLRQYGFVSVPPLSRLFVLRFSHSRVLALGDINHFRTSTRTFALSAARKVPMNDERSMVSFDLVSDDGTTTKVHVQPSYPQKPKAIENLLKQLPPLLTAASMPIGAIKSFNTNGWDLDESGDTIHRYVKLQRQQDLSRVLEDIEAASRELNHDPHIDNDGTQLTISCTTHVPPGLSMKDVKLAKRIDEILANVALEDASEEEIDEAEILIQRQKGRERNMEAIRKAKLNCDCG